MDKHEPLLLVQFLDPEGRRRAASVLPGGERLRLLDAPAGVRGLALAAIAGGVTLAEVVARQAQDTTVDYAHLVRERRLLPPVDHPDPAHLRLSGTGLTHRASAAGRDAMHQAAASGHETDSMRMYREGERGGRPGDGAVGALPEWFHKGDGHSLVAPGADLPSPGFALDGGDEAELAGVYLVGPDGQPARLGFTLANEFSDHLLERKNYLVLAHSKLRPAAIGPELLVGPLPDSLEGRARILRDGAELWSAPFLTGEAHMVHAIGNLEHHHFRYALHRQPGDLHVHFLGAAALSCAAGIETREGDVFEIHAHPFVQPLVNRLRCLPDTGLHAVRVL